MKIGMLAREAGVSTRALRYYEEQGLIRSTRTSGGQREYLEATVERVRFIQALFGAGLASRVVVEILPCIDTGAISPAQLALLTGEKENISTQIQKLKRARQHLTDVIASAEVRAAPFA